MAEPQAITIDENVSDRLKETYSDYDTIAQQTQVFLDVAEADREALVGPPASATDSEYSEDIDRAGGAKASAVRESKYLQQGLAEGDTDYKKRLQETEPFLVSPKLINYVVASIYNPDPQYTGVEEYADMMQSVNAHEQTYIQAMVEACDLALTCGFVFVLVDTTRTEDMGQLNRAQAKAAGVRPILSIYNPIGIKDWEYDSKGLAWVHLFETQEVRASFWQSREVAGIHTICDRQQVVRFKEVQEKDGKKKITLESQRMHGMEEVPGEFLKFLQRKKKKRGIGRSFIHASARADLAALRAESYRAISLQVHGTPHLWRRLSDKEWEMMTALRATQEAGTANPKPIDYAFIANQMQLGYSGYHTLVGAESDIGYATLDTGGLEHFRTAREDAHRAAMEGAGFDPATIRASGEGKSAALQSGVAKAYGYEMNQGVQIKYLSSRMAEFDGQILNKYVRMAGGTGEDVGVNYPPPKISISFDQMSDELDLLQAHDYTNDVRLEAYVATLPYLRLFEGKDPETMAKLTESMQNQQTNTEVEKEVVEVPEETETAAA